METVGIDECISHLEKLASEVLELKKTTLSRRPIIVEFCGSPKAGKTSCISSLELFLRRNKFRTKILTERASVCPVHNKYDPYFNIWTICSAISELSELCSNHSKDYDVILLDRGIFDGLCWFNWLLQHKHIDLPDFNSLESFLLMDRWTSVIDLVYVFTVSSDQALEREFANLLTKKTGRIMTEPVLDSLKNVYTQSIEKYKDSFKLIVNKDTTNAMIAQTNYEVSQNTLSLLLEATAEQIGYFDKKYLSKIDTECFDYSDVEFQKIKLDFFSRFDVEENENYVQPVPILVITDKNKEKVYVVRKNKKSTSDKSPEAGKDLIYFGGHVRKEDVPSSGTRMLDVARVALKREIKEETTVDYYPDKDYLPFCIWTRDNNRSKKHLALCYVHTVDPEAIKIILDKNEFSVRSKSSKFEDVSALAERYDQLESWSQIILQKVFNFKPAMEQVKIPI